MRQAAMAKAPKPSRTSSNASERSATLCERARGLTAGSRSCVASVDPNAYPSLWATASCVTVSLEYDGR